MYVLENGAWRMLDYKPNKLEIFDFHPYEGRLLMAGLFDDGSFQEITGATSIVEYDGQTFRRFKGSDSVITNGAILAKFAEYKGDLIVAGNINPYPPIDPRIKEIVRWTGTKWAPLGEGSRGGGLESVNDLAVHNGELYVAGIFKESTGGPGNNLAKWNGTSWSRLGDGIQPSSGVSAICFQGDTLNIAGYFRTANNHSSPAFARYYNGQWCYNTDSIVGPGVCLTMFNNSVIMGGGFSIVGAVPNQPLAKYLGSDCFKSTGLESPANVPDFALYPNPVSGVLGIRWASRPDGAVVYRVTDPLGRCVAQQASQSAGVSIDTRQWAGGVYWLEAQSGAQRIRRSFLKL